MIDLEAARAQWLKEKEDYEQFARHLECLTRKEMADVGISCRITSRVKDIDSLLKKVVRKGYETLDQMSDKTGVRVVVRYLDEMPAVDHRITEVFCILKREDKTASLGSDRLGYQGIHYDVALSPTDGQYERYEKLKAEIQVRTLSQDLWSEMDHSLRYKSELVVPPSIERRVLRLSALVELADEEFLALRKEIDQLPEGSSMRLLSALEKQYYKVTARHYDRDLSLEAIELLTPLYSSKEITNPRSYFDGFYATEQEKLTMIFSEYGQVEARSIFLFQPESIMIFDRLDVDPFALKERWAEKLPLSELEKLAVVWGRPLI